jgi:hypothetical protein
MRGITLTIPAGGEVTSGWDLAEATAVEMQLVNEGPESAEIDCDLLPWVDGARGVRTLAPGEAVVLAVRPDAATPIELPVRAPRDITRIRVGPCGFRRRPGGSLNAAHPYAWFPAPTAAWVSAAAAS